MHISTKRLKTEDAWSRYRRLRNESIKILRTAKQTHKTYLTETLMKVLCVQRLVEIFKMCIGKDTKDGITPLNYNNQVIPNDKADIFNLFFQPQSQLDDSNKDVRILAAHINCIDSIHTETEEVHNILKTLQVGKACGPDLINNRILREIAESVSHV